VVLDFRHEVASAMIAVDLDVSYIVINSCNVFGTTSVKPANLLVLPVIWLSYWISGAHRRPTNSEVPPLETLTPKTYRCSGWNFNFVAMCSRTRDTPRVVLPLPRCRQTSQKTVAGRRVNSFFSNRLRHCPVLRAICTGFLF